MPSYRWTEHRLRDGAGNDSVGKIPISLWWVAKAAAEETLQGSPMVAGLLKLFRSQLSQIELSDLRWRGDFAESAEIRRAYSGLYGRFFARAMLTHHIGLSRFVSLKRDGVQIPGSVHVKRISKGDIPDWIAWSDARANFALCEAKGSLTAHDFLTLNGPKCVHEGKAQFRRVATSLGGVDINPDEWVAASRWSTDERTIVPKTILWDPPGKDPGFSPEEADEQKAAMTQAWLQSLAPGLGWSTAKDLTSEAKSEAAIVVRAEPGDLDDDGFWADEISERSSVSPHTDVVRRQAVEPDNLNEQGHSFEKLADSRFYADRQNLLEPPRPELKVHTGEYLAAIVTRFGVRPIRSKGEFEAIQIDQERARRMQEPAMLICLPLDISNKLERSSEVWVDGAGIASSNDISLFDLRKVEIKPLERKMLI